MRASLKKGVKNFKKRTYFAHTLKFLPVLSVDSFLKALPFSDSLTKYVIKSNLVLAYCSHTCICICICICCTCIFERLRDLVVPCWADWQVTVLSHLHPLSRPPIMADRDCFDHQNTRQLEGGPTCQFQSQIVATVIFKTMRLRRFEIKAKEFICKLSSFNQNVGGEETRADDTPLMDGW